MQQLIHLDYKYICTKNDVVDLSEQEMFHLTNRMWFSVVCTLIDNDMRHHGDQNVVDSRGAAECVHNKF